jgi:hypothetical protein
MGDCVSSWPTSWAAASQMWMEMPASGCAVACEQRLQAGFACADPSSAVPQAEVGTWISDCLERHPEYLYRGLCWMSGPGQRPASTRVPCKPWPC